MRRSGGAKSFRGVIPHWLIGFVMVIVSHASMAQTTYDAERDTLVVRGSGNLISALTAELSGLERVERAGEILYIRRCESEPLAKGKSTLRADEDDSDQLTFAFRKMPDRTPEPELQLGGKPLPHNAYSIIFFPVPRRANYESAEIEIIIEGAGVTLKRAPADRLTANYKYTVLKYLPAKHKLIAWASRILIKGSLVLGETDGIKGDYQNQILELQCRTGDFSNKLIVEGSGELRVLDSEIRRGEYSRGFTLRVYGSLVARHSLFSGAQEPVLETFSEKVDIVDSTFRTGLSPAVIFHRPPTRFEGNYIEANDHPGISITEQASGTVLYDCEVRGFGKEYRGIYKPGVISVGGARLTTVNSIFPWECVRVRDGEVSICYELSFRAIDAQGKPVPNLELEVLGDEPFPRKLRTDSLGLTEPVVVQAKLLKPRPPDHPIPGDYPLALDTSKRSLRITSKRSQVSLELRLKGRTLVDVYLDGRGKIVRAEEHMEKEPPSKPRIIIYDRFNTRKTKPWKPLPGSRLSIVKRNCYGKGALKVTSVSGAEVIGCIREVDFVLTDDTRFGFRLFQSGDVSPLRAGLMDEKGQWYSDFYKELIYKPRGRWFASDRLVTHISVKPEMWFLSRGRHHPTAGTRIKAIRFIQERHPDSTNAEHSFIVDNVVLYDAFDSKQKKALFNPHNLKGKVRLRFDISLPKGRKHPCYVITQEKLERLRKKYRKNPTALRKAYIEPVEQWLTKTKGYIPLTYDPHYYVETFGAFCPVHSRTALKFDPFRPDWHWCEKCGKNYRGPTFRNIWIANRENYVCSIAYKASWAYQITGEKRYAELAREIVFKRLKFRQQSRRGRNLMGNRYLMQIYDLLYDALTDEEKEMLLNALRGVRYVMPPEEFRAPTKATVPKAKVSNYAGHSLKTQLYRAIFLEDTERIQQLLNAFVSYLNRGLNEEGLWWEKSIDYHHFFIVGMELFAKRAKKLGVDLYHHPLTRQRMRKSFEIELLLSMPNNRLPGFNDGAFAQGCRGRGLWTIYKDPRGKMKQPLRSVNLPVSRLAVLRSDVEERRHQFYACLDFSDYKTEGAHAHPDNLQLIIYASGNYLAPDLGEIGYSAREHFLWYNNVGSHNTLTIDPETSPRCPGGGEEVFFVDSPLLKFISVRAAPSKGVLCRRTLALEASGDFLVDMFSASSNEPHTYDYKWLIFGELSLDAPLKNIERDKLATTTGSGYTVLREVKAGGKLSKWQARWRLGDHLALLSSAGGESSEVFIAKAPGKTNRDTIEVLIGRRRASSTVFSTVFESFLQSGKEEDAPIIGRRVEEIRKVGDGFAVRTNERSYIFVANATPKAQASAGELQLTGEVGLAVRTSDGTTLAVALISGSRLRARDVCLSAQTSFSAYLSRSREGWLLQNGPQSVKAVLSLPEKFTFYRILSDGARKKVRAKLKKNRYHIKLDKNTTYLLAPRKR